jgi:hypothetical protein
VLHALNAALILRRTAEPQVPDYFVGKAKVCKQKMQKVGQADDHGCNPAKPKAKTDTGSSCR